MSSATTVTWVVAALAIILVGTATAAAYIGTEPPKGFEKTWEIRLILNFMHKHDRPSFCIEQSLLIIASKNNIIAIDLEAREAERIAALPDTISAIACGGNGSILAAFPDKVAILRSNGTTEKTLPGVCQYCWIEAITETPWGIAVATHDHVALISEEGSLLWKHKLGGFPLALFTTSSEVIVVKTRLVTRTGSLIAAIEPGGKLLWSKEPEAEASTAASIGNIVIVGYENRSLAAYNARDGTPLWSTTLPSTPRDIRVENGEAYILTSNGTIYVVNPSNGETTVTAESLEPQDLKAAALLPHTRGYIEFMTVLEEWKQGIALYTVPETGVIYIEAPKNPHLEIINITVEGSGGRISLTPKGPETRLYASPGTYSIHYRYRDPGLWFDDPSIPRPRLEGSLKAIVKPGTVTRITVPNPLETHGLLIVQLAPDTVLRIFSEKYLPLGAEIPPRHIHNNELKLLLPPGTYQLAAVIHGNEAAKKTVHVEAGEIIQVELYPSEDSENEAAGTAAASPIETPTTTTKNTSSTKTQPPARSTTIESIRNSYTKTVGAITEAEKETKQYPSETTTKTNTNTNISLIIAIIALLSIILVTIIKKR